MNNLVAIIYYHEVVTDGKGFSYQKIEAEKFTTQMKYLHDNGYATLHFSDLTAPIPPKSVIVSFDDGFRSVYENAAPIMKEFAIKGNVYLPTAYIGQKSQFMTWDMVADLCDNFEFQAHTHNHVDIRLLSRETMLEEIRLSDELFRQHSISLPMAFCMPYGTFDAASIKRLKETNRYDYILGSYYGRCRNPNSQKVLPRIGISNDDSTETFVDKLNGKYDWKGPLQKLRLGLHNIKKERIIHYEY